MSKTSAPNHPPGALKFFSVIMPARDEEKSLPDTLRGIYQTFSAVAIPHEIVVVDDGSKDSTWSVLQSLQPEIPTLAPVQNPGPHGFGRAIIYGLNNSLGDAVVIMMADASDSPADAVKYWRLLNDEGYECAFGSRFIKGGKVIDYPRIKLFVNRVANLLVKMIFRLPLNDTTNAFKAYRRTVIDGCRPLLAPHFNLTVEIPLKAIVRGYTWAITPISWQNRKHGVAKLKIKEMGSRYFSSAPTSGSKNISAVAITGAKSESFTTDNSRRETLRNSVPPGLSRCVPSGAQPDLQITPQNVLTSFDGTSLPAHFPSALQRA